MAGGSQSLSCQVLAVHQEEPPKPVLTSRHRGGADPPQPHSRAAAAPQLSTSHARAPTALCPAPQGKLRHNTTASPHLTLMLSQSPAPCRCPAWHTGTSGMLFTRRGPGTRCTSSCHQQCGRCKPSSLLVGAGAAWHRCSPLLWAHEAHLRLGEVGFAPRLALQQGHAAPPACRIAITEAFLATLCPPVQGPGAAATSRRAERWS